MTEVIRRFCEDEFAYDPRNTADGKVHLRKVTSSKRILKGRSVIAPYRVMGAVGWPWIHNAVEGNPVGRDHRGAPRKGKRENEE